ncbi:MAG: sulfite exporter TauE/SafE family protein [Clostridia bacterium]|nr:sulfite exporter TauE/SafE family protein [Clostridia bacterium]
METFLICLLVGIAAQLIDGTLGMAYGVSCSTFLRTAGISSAMSSACVHVAEIFTTLASGISHFSMKNVSVKLLLRLAVPGVIGGCIGAYLLTNVPDTVISPVISAYLVVMGVVIVSKMFRKSDPEKEKKIGFWVCPLAMIGGFSDSLGGGGWGPVVTSTLVAANHDIRKTIGSVNTAEFFVTLGESVVFLLTLPDLSTFLPSIIGLIAGGVIAAPLGAILCKKLPVRPLLGIVGGVIIAINSWKLISALL